MCEHARSMSALPSSESVPIGFHYPVFSKLQDLLTVLQAEIKPVAEHSPDHVAHVSDIIARTPLERSEWEQFTAFTEKGYTRHLLAHDDNFTVLLLCWNKGQKSPIHDHSGSSCWVKCLAGQLQETRYMPQSAAPNAPLDETSDAIFQEQEVAYMSDAAGYHVMGNPSSTEMTVTMHVYSPPFYNCQAFTAGGVARKVSMLAATAPMRNDVEVACTPEMDAAAAAPPKGEAAVSLVDLCTSLNEFPTTEADVSLIVDNFRRLHLTRTEWLTYAHFSDFRFQRLLIHKSDNYTLLMLCWLPGQATPPHDHHGSQSWVRVLSGELTLDILDGEHEGTSTLLKKGSDVFAEDSKLAVHVLGNRGSSYAISLHLYNPPYTELHYGSPLLEEGAMEGSTKVPHSCVKHLPVVQCTRFETTSSGSAQSSLSNSSFGGSSVGSEPNSPALGGALSAVPECHLNTFVVLLEKIEAAVLSPLLAESPEELSVAVMNALETTKFHQAEIDTYWASRLRTGMRVRLFENVSFSIVLNLWEPGHHSAPHDHDGCTSWVKVLAGTMHDLSYETRGGKTHVTRNSRMRRGDTCFYGPTAIHAMRNHSKSRAATTLHVYSGPNKACRWFSQSSDRPITVSSQSVMTSDWKPVAGAGSSDDE
jgi:cysteine dioxygenase